MVNDATDVPAGPRRLESLRVEFSEQRLVSDAGLLLTATFAKRLGLERLVNQTVRLAGPGAFAPGRKVMTLIDGMLAGADSIDDMDMLRSGSTGLVLGHRVMAPSTLGTFLRSFTFGHVRQLDRVLDVALRRAWAAGAGPGDGPLVIDIDSFIDEVYGHEKQGAAYGYTRVLGYHPLIATRADSGEILHIRTRKGSANTQRGILRFVQELLARVRRAGYEGQIVIRADSGFENAELMRWLERHNIEFSIGVKQHKTVSALACAIPEDAWRALTDYPAGGEAQVAETTRDDFRLVVRRTRLTGAAQQALFPDWRHHCFQTNRSAVPLLIADTDHRDHAEIELVIRDLLDQALAHMPSGSFAANSAWAVIVCLAHNLARWTTQIGLPAEPARAAHTRRRRLLAIPGRLTTTARTWTLRLPARWPWQHEFHTVLAALRALPATG